MKRNTLIRKVYYLYYDGFRQMTLGRTLWTVIIVKIAIMFLILKLFFFPDFLTNNAKDGDKATYVTDQFESRGGGE